MRALLAGLGAIFLVSANILARDIDGYGELTKEEKRYVLRAVPRPDYPLAARKAKQQVIGSLRVFVGRDARIQRIDLAAGTGDISLLKHARSYALKHWDFRLFAGRQGSMFWFDYDVIFTMKGLEKEFERQIIAKEGRWQKDAQAASRLFSVPSSAKLTVQPPAGIRGADYEPLTTLAWMRQVEKMRFDPPSAGMFHDLQVARAARPLVRLYVRADGTVAGTATTRSSGNPEVDRALLGRLAKARFAPSARPFRLDMGFRLGPRLGEPPPVTIAGARS